MKSSLFRFALAASVVSLAACADMKSNKHDAEKDQSPGANRYLQDPAAPQTQTADNPDRSGPPAAADSTTTPPPPKTDSATASTGGNPPTPPPPASQYPYGKPVPGKKGFVTSPYDEKAGMIDVRDYAPGTKVRDPYTNKIFLVP